MSSDQLCCSQELEIIPTILVFENVKKQNMKKFQI